MSHYIPSEGRNRNKHSVIHCQIPQTVHKKVTQRMFYMMICNKSGIFQKHSGVQNTTLFIVEDNQERWPG